MKLLTKLVTVAALAASLMVAAPTASADPLITEFSAGLEASNASGPEGIAPGTDGNVWFADQGTTKAIGRITPDATITEFSSGLAGHAPGGVAPGPDGNVWFTTQASPAIGRVTPGGMITTFTAGLQSSNSSIPQEIAAGADGNLWFDDRGPTPALGRITPTGTITEFSDGLQPGNSSDPISITAGPDGNMWFTDLGGPAIGRITPSGAITEFTDGLQGANSFPTDITAGPDGDLWFVDRAGLNAGTNAIGRITPSGTITEFSSGLRPANGSDPGGIALGADGNLWFTDLSSQPAIGRVTPAGAITEFSTGLQPGNVSVLNGIAPGPDGNLWFTDAGGTVAIGRVALQLPPTVTTGPASAIRSNSASVSGTVNPVGAAVGAISVQFGPTIAYGSTAAATPASLASGGVPVGVSAGLGGLTPATPIHYRVVATNAFGTTAGSDQTLTTLVAKPSVSKLSQSHSVWRAGSGRAKLSKRARRHPLGTTFSFTLNEPAGVRFAFTQRVTGRRAGHRCVPTTKKNRGRPRCKRTVTRGTLSLSGHAGQDKVSFQGRVSASKRLRRGRYTLVVTARAGAKASSPARLRFTIVKR
jgi:streptogramin lyase